MSVQSNIPTASISILAGWLVGVHHIKHVFNQLSNRIKNASEHYQIKILLDLANNEIKWSLVELTKWRLGLQNVSLNFTLALFRIFCAIYCCRRVSKSTFMKTENTSYLEVIWFIWSKSTSRKLSKKSLRLDDIRIFNDKCGREKPLNQ